MPIEQVLLRNQKLPENHQKGIFLSLAFYSAPSLHTADCCAFLGGSVFFFWGGGWVCGVTFVLWLSRLGSSPNGFVGGLGGTWFVLRRFCRRVVVLFGVFLPGVLLRGLIRPLIGRPKVPEPQNRQIRQKTIV